MKLIQRGLVPHPGEEASEARRGPGLAQDPPAIIGRAAEEPRLWWLSRRSCSRVGSCGAPEELLSLPEPPSLQERELFPPPDC